MLKLHGIMIMDTPCQGLTIWTNEKIVPLPRGVFWSSFCSCSSLLPANEYVYCQWAASSSQLPAVCCISLLTMGFPLYLNQWDLLALYFGSTLGVKYTDKRYMCTGFVSAMKPRKRFESEDQVITSAFQCDLGQILPSIFTSVSSSIKWEWIIPTWHRVNTGMFADNENHHLSYTVCQGKGKWSCF